MGTAASCKPVRSAALVDEGFVSLNIDVWSLEDGYYIHDLGGPHMKSLITPASFEPLPSP